MTGLRLAVTHSDIGLLWSGFSYEHFVSSGCFSRIAVDKRVPNVGLNIGQNRANSG